MDTFEQAFSDTEKAATLTLKSATALAKLVRGLQRAAKDGNINAIKKASSSLDAALGVLRQTVANAVETWPFKDEEEEGYLREHYTKELRDTAEEKGLDIHERDGKLISYPSIVRVLPRDRAVRIDRKQVSTLRPSRLAGILVENQKKPPRFKSGVFLEALYKRYLVVSRGQTSVVPLARIYEQFTSLPGSEHEYSKIEFARDLYVLEDSGTLSTKSGARVSFPSSTGAKKTKNTFPFVNPDGQVVTYYGIRFSRGA